MRDSIIAEYTDAKYTVERLQTYRPRCSPTSLRPHERFRALLESLDSSLDLRKEALTKLENELSMLNTKIFPSPEKMTDAEAAELSASLAEIFNKITQIQYLDSLHFPAAFHEGLRKKLLNPLAVINETLQAIQKGYQTLADGSKLDKNQQASLEKLLEHYNQCSIWLEDLASLKLESNLIRSTKNLILNYTGGDEEAAVIDKQLSELRIAHFRPEDLIKETAGSSLIRPESSVNAGAGKSATELEDSDSAEDDTHSYRR